MGRCIDPGQMHLPIDLHRARCTHLQMRADDAYPLFEQALMAKNDRPGPLSAVVCDMNAAPRIILETVLPYINLLEFGVVVLTMKNFLGTNSKGQMESEIQKVQSFMTDLMGNCALIHLFANGQEEKTLVAFRG